MKLFAIAAKYYIQNKRSSQVRYIMIVIAVRENYHFHIRYERKKKTKTKINQKGNCASVHPQYRT